MAYLRDILHRLLEPSGIDYQIDLPEDGGVILTNEFTRNVILIVKEVVNNAIKHAHANHIQVHGILSGNRFMIGIRDDGVGFECTGNATGNGLKNVATRVKNMKGVLAINAVKAKGTTINIEFVVSPEP
jgi:signal transduction histidine kinase